VEEVPSLESLAALEVAAAEQDGKTRHRKAPGQSGQATQTPGRTTRQPLRVLAGRRRKHRCLLPSEEARGTEQELRPLLRTPEATKVTVGRRAGRRPGLRPLVDADRIELRWLRALGRHGASKDEQDTAQPFEIDLEVEADFVAAS